MRYIFFMMMLVGILFAKNPNNIDSLKTPEKELIGKIKFLINPRIKIAQTNPDSSLQTYEQTIQKETDSLRVNYRIFVGKILNNLSKDNHDSLLVYIMNKLEANAYSPTDFSFNFLGNSRLLASNFEIADSIGNMISNAVLTFGKTAVGLITIYSPDWVVKTKPNVKVNYKMFNIIDQQIKELSSKCDYFVLMTNLPKFIVKDIVKNRKLNTIINFDYARNKSSILYKTKNYIHAGRNRRTINLRVFKQGSQFNFDLEH